MFWNSNLHKAKDVKNDEFYTQLSDIENELRHYKEHFKWKTILCNCDDPRVSNFFHYFAYNFEHLGLKRLITTCYKNRNPDLFSLNNSESAVYLIYDWDKNWNNVPDMNEIWINELKWNWDFRSEECIELLKQADIVVTNPPFSLFREYIAELIDYNKNFLVIWNQNAITYKEIFPLIKENRLWLWFTHPKEFLVPNFDKTNKNTYIDDNWLKKAKFWNICWYTNLDISKRHEELICYQSVKSSNYYKYENYDAIDVNKVSEIPVDYYWVMWVPITFLDKYNPEQFEIIWCPDYTWLYGSDYMWVSRIWEKWINQYRKQWWTGHYTANMTSLVYFDETWKACNTFKRILIRRKK